jgi:hypothetical protein
MLLTILLIALACGLVPHAAGLAWGAASHTMQIVPDAYEPDNTFISANTIVPGTTQEDHNFHLPGDEDWVQFGAAAGASYTIETLNAEDFCDTVIRLYEPDGISEITSVDTWGSGHGERLEWTATGSGTYYVQVHNFNDTFGEDTHYDLSLSSNADAYEPDDDYTNANTIAIGETQADHDFHSVDDEDWLQFSTVTDAVVTIETSDLGPYCDTHLYLYDTDGTTELTNDDDGGGESKASRIEWTAPDDDTYYVRVVNRSGASGDGTAYSISMDSTYDAYEPDDDDTQASTPSPCCVQSRHSFHVAYDDDWMAFWATRSVTYTIETLNPGPNCDTVIVLYDTDGVTTIGSPVDDFGLGQGERIDWVAPNDGTYYVRVHHYDSTHGVGTGYDVMVRPPACLYCPLVRMD